LPAAAGAVLSVPVPAQLAVFALLALAVVVKEFVISSKRLTLWINVGVCILSLLLSGLYMLALWWPLHQMLQSVR